MTKAPGEFQPTKPITKEQREARKAFRQVEAEKAMSEYESAQRAFSANRERLKAERLEREGCRDADRSEESQAQEQGQMSAGQ